MTHEEPPDVETRLREAFRADDVAAGRVVRGAFARAGRTARWRFGWRIGMAAAAVVLVLVGAFLVPPRPEPATAAAPPALSGSLTDGMLVVDFPDGSASITDAGPRDGRPPDGFGIILVEGETR